ncbi:hypothetical protein [Schlesneria sp.]|uniref:hypothetical protein n=1 Tax=Schlesneria sp. TaxID=2762018 RepID=UPI002EFCE127
MKTGLRFAVITWGLLISGCGKPREIPGGTPGIIHAGGDVVGDVHISIYRMNDEDSVDETPVAFAISAHDGQFELRQSGSLEGASLEAGDYRFTVESAGEIYLAWPGDYRKPARSPLRLTWNEDDQQIDLEVPVPTRVR